MAIQERFGYNVNDLSYRGAGSTYEVLASNAAGQGKAAAQRRDTALSEYSKSMSQFNRYFAASQSTAQASQAMLRQARATENKGVETLNKAVQIENAGRAALQSSAQNLNKVMALHGINDAKFQAAYQKLSLDNITKGVNGLFTAGKTMASFVEQAALKEGQLDGMKIAGELSRIQDPSDRLEAIEKYVAKAQKDPSVYNRAIIGKISPLYLPTVQEAEIQRQQTLISSAVSLAEQALTESGAKYEIGMEELQKYYKNNNVNVGAANIAIYSSTANKIATEIIEAKDEQQLDAILNKWETIKKNNFNNNYFIKSKTPSMVTTQKNADATINKAITAKKKEIVLQNKQTFVSILQNPLQHTPDEAATVIQNISQDPIKRKSLAEQYNTAVTKEFELAEINALNPDVGDNRRGKPVSQWNTETKKVFGQRVTTEVITAITTGNLKRVQEIVTNQPEFIKDAGENIYRTMVSATTDNSTQNALIQQTLSMSTSTDGMQSLQYLLGPTKTAEILILGNLTKFATGGDIDEARKLMFTAKNSGVPQDVTYKQDIRKKAMALGIDGAMFTKMVNVMYANAPQSTADEAAERLYESIKDTQKQITIKPTLFHMGGTDVKVSTSKAPNPFTNDKEAQAASEAMLVLYQTQFGEDSVPTHIEFLPGGRARVRNVITNETIEVNTQQLKTKVYDKVNKDASYESLYEKFRTKYDKLANLVGWNNNSVSEAVEFTSWASEQKKLNPIEAINWYGKNHNLSAEEFDVAVQSYAAYLIENKPEDKWTKEERQLIEGVNSGI